MKIEVGKTYNSDGVEYKCFYIEGEHAWLKHSRNTTAYVWTLDGKSVSLDSTYDIDLEYSQRGVLSKLLSFYCNSDLMVWDQRLVDSATKYIANWTEE